MRRTRWQTFRPMVMAMGLAVASVAAAVPLEYPEGDLWGFPAMQDTGGKLLGRGRFGQWVDGRGIHVKATYDQLNGDKVEEATTLSTEGNDLAQREWSWQRTSGGQVVERYTMNLDSGEGRVLVVRGGKREERRDTLKAVKGRTFVGIGFVYAVKNLTPRLARGEKVELEGIAFTPKARKAKVLVSFAGVETLRSGGRSLKADHVVVHPMVSEVAKLFAKVTDSHLWFFKARPPSLVRAQLQMQSLGVVQIDAVSSGAAPPAAARSGPKR